MSKPDLRAGLETDLVEICEGRKTKEEVLAAQLVKYKAVFETADWMWSGACCSV